MRPRLQAAKAAAIVLAGAAGVSIPHLAAAAPSAPRSAADCRAITDFTARGECWDALDHAGLHDEQVQRKKNFGLGAKPPAAAKPERVAQAKRAKPQNDGVDDLTLTLADVGATPLGRILLTSTDGAVWEQTDSDTVTDRPAPGDTVEVSKGSLGGYMCHVTRWQLVRCQRIE